MIETRTFRRAILGVLGAAAAASAQAPATATPVTMSLGDAIRAAAMHSAPAEVARLRIDEARARVTEARSALLPRISGNVLQSGRSFNTATFGLTLPGFDPNGEVVGPVNTTDLRGQIGQTIYDAAARARVTAARSAVDASAAEANSAAELAAAVAGAAYVRALRAEANLRSRTADSTLSADLLDIARQRLEAGVGIALDVTRAQSQLAGMRAQLIAARNDQSRSRLELLRAVGLPLDTPINLADTLGLTSPEQAPDAAAAVDAALRQRADVRALEEQIGTSRQQINAIRAERLPTFGLLADEGVIGKSPAHLLPTYTWGLQVSVPIFDGNRRQARVAEQSAAIQELEARERDLRAQVAVEVRGALLDLASAREQVEAARERVRLGEQEVSQARDRFSAGVAGNADVISASLSLSAARTGLVEAEAAYQAARVALARAEGTLTTIK
jgi:outer membrane protein TolC